MLELKCLNKYYIHLRNKNSYLSYYYCSPFYCEEIMIINQGLIGLSLKNMTKLELQLKLNNILVMFLLVPFITFIDIYKLLVTFASFLDEVHRRHFLTVQVYTLILPKIREHKLRTCSCNDNFELPNNRNRTVLPLYHTPILLAFDIHTFSIARRQGNFPLSKFLACLTFGVM